MIKIQETSRMTDNIFPDGEYLEGSQEGYDFGSFLSTLSVNAMIGEQYFRLGDSSVCIEAEFTGNQFEAGMEEFKEAARAFVPLMEKALPEMGGAYAGCYQHYLDDFKENGLSMPMYGKLLDGDGTDAQENFAEAVGALGEGKPMML